MVCRACFKEFNTNSGVPQGAVLSHTLFLLFINDLFSSTCNPVHAYADDSTLHASESFKSAPSDEDRAESWLRISQAISEDLVKLSQWARIIWLNLIPPKRSYFQFPVPAPLPIFMLSLALTLSIYLTV
jgi:hypothetical protein